MRLLKTFMLFCFIPLCYCSSSKPVIQKSNVKKNVIKPATEVISGLENFLQNHLQLVHNKRVGLITNPSGIDRNYNSTADLFFELAEINLTTLFSVEHGIRGDADAGQKISDYKDPITDLPVYSLYGSKKKPTVEMLDSIDVLIFDIQDVGVRSYTYISSMGMIIEAAAENNVEIIILDRPNPLSGLIVEGNIAEEFSMVSYYPIAYCHGMTVGEIALMYNSENNLNAELTIIPLLNWQRSMFWDETGLPWIPTSPHVPHWETTLFLPLTGVIGELLSLNIGVGYTAPFEYVGAPWINAHVLADSLNSLKLPGLYFSPSHFKPYYSIHKGENCHGVQIHILDKHTFKPFIAGIYILKTLSDLYPDQDLFSEPGRLKSFNHVLGSSNIYNGLKSGKRVEEIEAEWQPGFKEFLETRQKYLLY